MVEKRVRRIEFARSLFRYLDDIKFRFSKLYFITEFPSFFEWSNVRMRNVVIPYEPCPLFELCIKYSHSA